MPQSNASRNLRATPIAAAPSSDPDVIQLVPANPRHLHPTANERKLSHVIVTSKDETAADVECKSESQPLFFKPLFSRFQSDDRTKARTARKQQQKLLCRSQSTVLNLKANREPSTTESPPKPRKPVRRELSDDLSTSASYYSPSITYEIPAVQNYRDIVRQYYSQQYLAPAFNSVQQPINYVNYPTLRPLYVTPAVSYSAPSKETLSSSQGSLLNRNINVESTTGATKIGMTVAPTWTSKRTTQEIVIEVDSNENKTSTRNETRVLTKIILRPLARAKAGHHGVAIASPISTAYIKRGDYVEIEYLPEASADVGEGGVAISKPELIIHFVDRRRK